MNKASDSPAEPKSASLHAENGVPRTNVVAPSPNNAAPEANHNQPGDALGATATAAAASQLTPEEQMAAFENELKEKDWGHQPC